MTRTMRVGRLLPWVLPPLMAACSAAGGQGPVAEREGEGTATATTSQATPAVKQGRATRVEVATVTPSSAQLALRLPGEVEGSRDALLAAALGGFVERVSVRDGDRVKRGQILLRIDSELHEAHVARASAELAQAERDYERAKRLGQAIAAAEVERTETLVATARSALQVAKVQLSRALIRAPFDGVVAEVAVEQGEVAAPGAPVARLVQLHPAKVSLAVADRDVVALEAGMQVRVATEAGGRLHEGVITHISPAANLRTRSFTVDVEVPNEAGHLLPGMIASVEVSTQAVQDRVVLPQHVLVTRREGNGLFIVEEGRARWRPVELGPLLGRQVVIESGVETGDAVVVTGHRELSDGDGVIVARQGTCCADGRVRFEER
jgi:RND family efflux transporter MFP subunit